MGNFNFYFIASFTVQALLICFYFYAIHDTGKRIAKYRLRNYTEASNVSQIKRASIYLEVVAYSIVIFFMAYILFTDINKSMGTALTSLILFWWGVTDGWTIFFKNKSIS